MSAEVDEILFRTYCARVDADGEGNAAKLIEKDSDGGVKMRRRAECFRAVVTEALVQAGVYQRPVRVAPNRKKGGK